MRVEVRRRPSPAGPTPKRSASASPGLVKAYADSCFESSTTFFVASPEHPKLGKWAEPSALKYSQLPQQVNPLATKCLDEAMLFASSNGGSRPRTAGGSSRGGSHRTSRRRGSAANGASPSDIARPGRPAVEPARSQRPISPKGTGTASIQGQREAPRIDTPISGRVAPLHHRSFTTSTLPASPTLCGSFDRHHHPRTRSAGADICNASPVIFDWAAAAVDRRGGGDRPPVLFEMGGATFGVKHAGYEGEGERRSLQSRHQEKEQADEPHVRYRVETLIGCLLDGKSKTTEGARVRHGSEGHHSAIDALDQGDPSLPTGADGKALQRQGRNESLVAPPGEEVGSWGIDGIVGDGVGVDPWVASQVDPFMSSLREALLRHRPADVPAYVSAFSADRQRQRQLQREKETVLT